MEAQANTLHFGLFMWTTNFIMRSGKHLNLGTWIRAVYEGQTAPRAAEALQMLKEMNEKCTQEQIGALEASLDWVPM
eukprot:1101530-Karenia_brevis.AAC.1